MSDSFVEVNFYIHTGGVIVPETPGDKVGQTMFNKRRIRKSTGTTLVTESPDIKSMCICIFFASPSLLQSLFPYLSFPLFPFVFLLFLLFFLTPLAPPILSPLLSFFISCSLPFPLHSSLSISMSLFHSCTLHYILHVLKEMAFYLPIFLSPQESAKQHPEGFKQV